MNLVWFMGTCMVLNNEKFQEWNYDGWYPTLNSNTFVYIVENERVKLWV